MKLWNGRWGGAAILTAAATAGLLAVPGTAGAAVTGTGATASLTFQSATVAAGAQPQLTFITSGTPAGAVVYVQEEGAGEPWHSIGRIQALSGTVDVPADQAGSYQYRLAVASGAGAAIVTSAPAALTVSGPGGTSPAPFTPAPAPSASASADGCTACGVANDALPLLALIIDPTTVWDTITTVLSTIGDALLAFLGL
jgi:hypothetical protein